jgi:uncharacterized membrane protein (UPF0127 family)
MTLTFVSRLVAGASTALAVCLAAAQERPQLDLPVTQLQAGMHLIRAQVAQRPDERATGLMHRREMPPNEGMLFVFEQPGVQCFWMKNTLIPLAIAFVDDAGTVVNVREMQPGALNSHCSDKPVRYALEMNQGWFAKRGIKPGSVLTGRPFVSRSSSPRSPS